MFRPTLRTMGSSLVTTRVCTRLSKPCKFESFYQYRPISVEDKTLAAGVDKAKPEVKIVGANVEKLEMFEPNVKDVGPKVVEMLEQLGWHVNYIGSKSRKIDWIRLDAKRVKKKVKELEQELAQMLEQKLGKELEQKLDQKLEQQLERKLERKLEQKLERKLEDKLEEQLEDKLELKLEMKLEEKLELKLSEKLGREAWEIEQGIHMLLGEYAQRQKQQLSQFYFRILFSMVGVSVFLMGSSWILLMNGTKRLDGDIQRRGLTKEGVDHGV